MFPVRVLPWVTIAMVAIEFYQSLAVPIVITKVIGTALRAAYLIAGAFALPTNTLQFPTGFATTAAVIRVCIGVFADAITEGLTSGTEAGTIVAILARATSSSTKPQLLTSPFMSLQTPLQSVFPP